jgi:hypothetical protein
MPWDQPKMLQDKEERNRRSAWGITPFLADHGKKTREHRIDQFDGKIMGLFE